MWAETREEEIATFCEQNPLIVEIKERFIEYDNRADAIRELPEVHKVGAIEVNMGNIFLWNRLILFFCEILCLLSEKFKLALLIESDAWKHLLGKHLGVMYKVKLMEMVDFIKTQEKVLAKPIKDLDDCRFLEWRRRSFFLTPLDNYF